MVLKIHNLWWVNGLPRHHYKPPCTVRKVWVEIVQIFIPYVSNKWWTPTIPTTVNRKIQGLSKITIHQCFLRYVIWYNNAVKISLKLERFGCCMLTIIYVKSGRNWVSLKDTLKIVQSQSSLILTPIAFEV